MYFYQLTIPLLVTQQWLSWPFVRPHHADPNLFHTWVEIFAWRLSQDGLSMQCNRKQRKLARISTCEICGTEEESSHHAVVRCTKESEH
jgi:hypothetical protein